MGQGAGRLPPGCIARPLEQTFRRLAGADRFCATRLPATLGQARTGLRKFQNEARVQTGLAEVHAFRGRSVQGGCAAKRAFWRGSHPRFQHETACTGRRALCFVRRSLCGPRATRKSAERWQDKWNSGVERQSALVRPGSAARHGKTPAARPVCRQ